MSEHLIIIANCSISRYKPYHYLKLRQSTLQNSGLLPNYCHSPIHLLLCYLRSLTGQRICRLQDSRHILDITRLIPTSSISLNPGFPLILTFPFLPFPDTLILCFYYDAALPSYEIPLYFSPFVRLTVMFSVFSLSVIPG